VGRWSEHRRHRWFFGEKLCSSFSLVDCALQWLKRIENLSENAVNIGPAAPYFKRRRVGN
jgi:hypothetical protein